jgi:hypothetical protein
MLTVTSNNIRQVTTTASVTLKRDFGCVHLCGIPVLLGLQLLVVLMEIIQLLPHPQQLGLVGLQQLLHRDDLLPVLQLLLLNRYIICTYQLAFKIQMYKYRYV